MKPEDFIPTFQNGRTELLTGFQSKEGKAFDARLLCDAKAKNFSFAFEERRWLRLTPFTGGISPRVLGVGDPLLHYSTTPPLHR
jgi:hypothetical protein